MTCINNRINKKKKKKREKKKRKKKLLVRLKPVVLARNLALNSDAAPNYKHMFGPHRGPLPHK